MPDRSCQGPLSRRGFLQVGSLGVAGLGMSELLRAREASAQNLGSISKDTSVIFIWLPGGPPHMETYDMKPEAPDEFRGDFKPVKTNVPGIDVCEHLPLHTNCADRYSLIRSISHTFADHGGGHKKFLTGRDPLEPTGFVNDYPAVPSFVAMARSSTTQGIPPYVAGMDGGREGVDVFSFGSAYLGPAHTPFTVPGDPAEAAFQVRNLTVAPQVAERLDDRQKLLSGFDRMRRNVDKSGKMMGAMDTFNRQAVELLTSDKARNAFDLSKESEAIRDRYGRHRYGQRCLLARRLVEAGVSFVTMVLENPSPPGGSFPADCCYNWDSHAVNCHIFNDSLFRFPFYDRAITALVEDLYSRGLDKKVLLVVTGEFGRTPRISYDKGRPGRDHWPQAMSVLVSGGGLRMGQVVGSTNSKGEHPHDRPLVPNDLWATMFRHLGIDPGQTVLDHMGRPMYLLNSGTPISELL